jgi:hypothetical protein
MKKRHVVGLRKKIQNGNRLSGACIDAYSAF